MLLPCTVSQAAIAVTFLLCTSLTLPVICGPTITRGNSVNAGASSAFSPFYYYSRTLTDGWTIRLREESDLTLFVPIQTSTVQLMDFYNAVFQSASDKNIALAPPVVSCILRHGQLELLVSARSVPVPWNLTALFAANMLHAARGGYTAGYSLEFVPPGETLINSPNAAQIMPVAAMLLRLLPDKGMDCRLMNSFPIKMMRSYHLAKVIVQDQRGESAAEASIPALPFFFTDPITTL